MNPWFTRQLESSASVQKVMTAFRALTKPQQTLALVTLFCVLLLLLAKMTVIPLYDDYKKSSLRLERAKSNYAMLEKHVDELSSMLQSKVEFIDRSSVELRTLVNESLKTVDLSPEVMSREGTSLLRIGVSEVPFEKVATWLNDLAHQQVKINSLQIQAISPGVVSLNISLD